MSANDDYKDEMALLLEAFGNNVRGIRTAREPALSQERLAHITQLHRTEIGKIEQGKVEPHLTTLMILADGLGTRLDDLVVDLWVPKYRKTSSRAKL
jgi:DNA-binding XRE family transcriptional regulator